MLSYVEHYAPDYFLLENVKGILNYPLMARQAEHGAGLEGGIKNGVPKWIASTLIALGLVSKAPSPFSIYINPFI